LLLGHKTPQTLITQLLRIIQEFQTRSALFVRIKSREGKANDKSSFTTPAKEAQMLQENQTGKPSSDAIEKHGDAARDIRFQSLTDFSDWLETQLENLEAKQRDFATQSSVRVFFKR
tara:strand:- start:2355 stop:2705 length:351 start_codon:yes stop_codon:yes gene_type:complete